MPAGIYADKNIVEKIVMNLLNNAFKYTPDRGTVVLETRCKKGFASSYKNSYTVGESANDVFSIIVSDTGVGISSESISSVFERFYKVDNFTQGAGLGLSICQTIVERLKGTISVTSEVGKGTRFTVRLPNYCE